MCIRIALAGNPNSGKTTLFNLLTGSNQYVGNWPGVTVEKKEGVYTRDESVIIVDLPGIYSLSPYTPEEIAARDHMLHGNIDAIINIVDGTNLERNLYLTMQLAELSIPMVVAVNMIDVVKKRGYFIDIKVLSQALGCTVVPMSAVNGYGIENAVKAAVDAAQNKAAPPHMLFSEPVETTLLYIKKKVFEEIKDKSRWYEIKLFERDSAAASELNLFDGILKKIDAKITAAEKELDDESAAIIINERYQYIDEIIKKSYKKGRGNRLSMADKLDKILTGRLTAIPIFAFVLALVFYVSVTVVGGTLSEFLKRVIWGEGILLLRVPSVTDMVSAGLDLVNCAVWLKSLIIDGIISGVGAVLEFVPQIFVLFVFLAFLEFCGYMPRIAFIMDKLFRRFGLSGKSVIPLLVGAGCGVPGIASSRTIESERDRRITVITTTFIPCSAKVPFIVIMANALFKNAWWVLPSTYLLGVSAVLISGSILKKAAVFSGKATPFIMEMPEYRLPPLSSVFRSAWVRCRSFVKKAGSVILVSSIIVWFTANFGFTGNTFSFLSPEQIEYSVLATIGKTAAWLFVPLGFGNWQSAVASLAGLAAKENIVSTMGVLFSGGKGLNASLCKVFMPYSGYAFLAFNLLCAPCAAAIGAISREMNSFKWTVFAIGYQTGFAYCAAFVINQLGKLLSGTPDYTGAAFSAFLIMIVIYLLIKPQRKEKRV